MNAEAFSSDICQKKTRMGVLLSSLLNEPLITIYVFLPVIMRKSLGASAFEISLLIMLKPLVSILSFYWSANLSKRKNKLRSNFLMAGFFGRVLFLFYPFVDNVWFLIFSAVIYMLFYRAQTPAWVEILKLNLPKKSREKIFSFGFGISYLEGVLIGFGIGPILDYSPYAWKWLFFITAIIGMINLYIMSKIPINHMNEISVEEKGSLKEFVLRPWKNSYELMKTKPEFSLFQWAFMICGFGVMLLQPVLPLFLVDRLHVSYTELAIALSVCKGMGVFLSSPIWSRMMHRISFFSLSCFVFLFFGLQPLFLCFSTKAIICLYVAYLFYGIAQGGSNLIWHFSGHYFSGKSDSSIYTGVNVVMVGIRGSVAPPLGGLLAELLEPFVVLIIGMGFCFYSGYFLIKKRVKDVRKVLFE